MHLNRKWRPRLQEQLQKIIIEFESAEGRLRALIRDTPPGLWTKRPAPDRWSMSECVQHLNLTSQAYLPLLRDGIVQARQFRGPAPARYQRDFTGWLLWKMSGPPVRFGRVKTTAPFVPASSVPIDSLVEEFARLQSDQMACVRAAEGLPLQRIRITSPFNARVRYNLYAAFTILPRHQHRHLWQAEQARDAVR